MRPAPRVLLICGLAFSLSAALVVNAPRACVVAAPISDSASWDSTQARGRTRSIEFTTDVGTMMSVSAAPNSRWIAFDLLGNIYRLPAEGGEALCLTCNSGVALNFHPTVSPNGDAIAFVSDRTGQNGLWVMRPDGTDPRALFADPESRISEPTWSPDGRTIAAVRAFATPGRGWHAQTAHLWMFDAASGAARELLGDTLAQFNSPAFSPDGRYLYLHVSYEAGNRYGTQAAYHIERVDLETGRRETITQGFPTNVDGKQFKAADWNGLPAASVAEIAPEPSPDGHYLAFARQMPGSMVYRGHVFNHRTGLWLRDLRSDRERLLLDPITTDLTSVHAMYSYKVLPGYGWAGDSASLFLSVDGKLKRIQVADGDVREIPFSAPVSRTISEQTRSHVRIDDRTLAAQFLQSPSSSPDATRTAFVSVGRIWIVNRAHPVPVPLATTSGVQLTPAWSPDGKWIAFTNWDDAERGHVWLVTPGGKRLRRLTTEAGEYLNPAWSPDGRYVVVARGPGPTATEWNGWHAGGKWAIVRLPVTEQEPPLALTEIDIPSAALNGTLMAMIPSPSFGPAGRVYFQDQPNMAASLGLFQPYPSDAALAQHVLVKSIGFNGGPIREELDFPAAMGEGSRPVVSPSGRWIAYQADQEIYLTSRPSAAVGRAPHVAIDPNLLPPETVRVGRIGGVYHRWNSANRLEFASGDRLALYDPATHRLHAIVVKLTVPRLHPEGTLALQNARIITLAASGVIERGTVLIHGSRIVCVGECSVSGVDRVVDLGGTTIIPGLVDVHAHNGREPSGVVPRHRSNSAAYLAYGVTTTVDPAIFSAAVFPIADLTESGFVRGPRIETTAEIFASPSAFMFGDKHQIRSYADAVDQVDRRVRWGAITLKNYRQTRREQHQMLIAAARRKGVTVTGEGGPLFFDLGLAMDGQTGWEHILAPLPIYSDVSRFFGQATMVYSPTASVAGHPRGSFGYYRAYHDLLSDQKYLRFMPAAQIRAIMATSQKEDPDLSNYSFPLLAEGLSDIVHAGGYGAIGEHKEQPGIGSHWEIWAYATALGNLEALRVGTLDGAYFLGLDNELGSISPGKIADLLVLNANPIDRIEATADIRYVLKAGVLYDAQTLDEIWPQHEPFGPTPWQHTADTQPQ